MASAILNEPAETSNSAFLPVAKLPFNGQDVPVYDIDGRPHLSGAVLGRLLGYKSRNSVATIHKRHADELDPHSTVVRLTTVDGKTRETRAYDEPGSYLLTMFAGTPVAKDVRLWLAKLPRRTRELACSIQPAASAPEDSRLTTAKERNALAGLVNRYVGMMPGGPNQEAYKAAWRKVHEVMGIGSIEELTVEQLPRAVLFVKSLVDATSLPEAEPVKALPPASTRNTMDDYKALYRSLPPSPQYWMGLLSEYAKAHEAFGRKLDEIKVEATKPFRVNRKSGVSTYFDEAMSPIYSLFGSAEKSQHLAYCNVFDAMNGCRHIWLLLHKG